MHVLVAGMPRSGEECVTTRSVGRAVASNRSNLYWRFCSLRFILPPEPPDVLAALVNDWLRGDPVFIA
ncbi:hypothetical protein PLANPX_1326 [Lacipirellula parvula]|uniref:Uncharacterized protein n=1 Tax=Lacipirellula parvula TaxID=2650471 RepID=A0A5K7X4V2_9BACT|nr:hypothetical protein PLANPX_1326 [Lacipirellula parvula]